MPAYNAVKYIGESIESVITQTYTNWELIIVNDGSTDETEEVVKRYQEKERRIRYLYQDNKGQGPAKNTGIAACQGQYIAFLDADDLWLKEKLEISVAALEKSGVTLLFTNYLSFTEDSAERGFTDNKIGEHIYEGRASIIQFLAYNQIPNLTVLVRREAVLATPGFIAIRVAEDYDMWLQLLANGGRFLSISRPLSLYRVHNGSITANDRHATFEVIQIIKAFGKQHAAYQSAARTAAGDKIKYWLYNGYGRTPRKFRQLIHGVFDAPLTVIFYGLSFLLPVDQLRKIVIRLC